MNVKTTIKYVRIAPRKVHRVISQITGKHVGEAFNILKFLPHHSARILVKILNSAVYDAKNNYNMNENNLIVHEGYVGQAVIMKRFTPMSRGRAGKIQKKFSHITILLKEGNNNGSKN